MRPEIKFCGMTRAEDVDAAVALGARYVGVILAGGPRLVSVDRARELMRRVPRGVHRVGVIGRADDGPTPGDLATEIGLDIVQLHDDPDVAAVASTRDTFSGAVWAALRVRGGSLPSLAGDLFGAADAVVVDAHSPTALGGTGRALPWMELAEAIAAVRKPGRFVLAGGLRPDNVSAAVRALHPDVVDVSSGVESAPGVKDHALLKAFRDSVAREAATP